MSTEIYVVLISTLGTILLAGASYWFTKKREHEAEIRKEKLEHYKAFVRSISGIIEGESTPQSQRDFAIASNALNLVAPQSVLVILRDFQREIRVSNSNRTQERHDLLLSKLLYAIRKDLNIKPRDNPSNCTIELWSSGFPPDAS